MHSAHANYSVNVLRINFNVSLDTIQLIKTANHYYILSFQFFHFSTEGALTRPENLLDILYILSNWILSTLWQSCAIVIIPILWMRNFQCSVVRIQQPRGKTRTHISKCMVPKTVLLTTTLHNLLFKEVSGKNIELEIRRFEYKPQI